MCCACLLQHRIAWLRKKLWDFGHSWWKMNWNVLICYGNCIIGRDDCRIVLDSMEGIKRESCARNLSFIHITNSIFWSGVRLTFNKKEKNNYQYTQLWTTIFETNYPLYNFLTLQTYTIATLKLCWKKQSEDFCSNV